MSYKKIIYIGLVLLGLIGGCGLKEGVTLKEPKSFIWFTGNTDNAVVYIDDLNPFILNEKSSNLNDEDENDNRKGLIHYQISPGKHKIVVIKSGTEVVNRDILLGNGITKEIQIP
jgi:hypothetical protein